MSRAQLAMRLDSAAGRGDHLSMEPRIASLEAITESTVKAMDELRRRVDEGFRDARRETSELRTELRSEIRDARNESNERFKELRTEMRETSRWFLGIQITTLLAVLGLLARSANLF